MQFNVNSKRIYALLGFFAIIASVVLLRLFWIQIIDAEWLSKDAVQSRTVSYKIEPKRGTIYDRNGNVLAYSKDAYNVYSNPSEIQNVSEVANALAKHLGGSASDYIGKINDSSLKFSYIKRRVDVEVADAIKADKVTGIYFEDTQKRIYPYNRAAGQIIGAIDIDGNGLCGIELYYDDILKGSTGATVRQEGNHGMPIPGGVMQDRAVVDGQDIMLSIDIDLQQKVEDYLEASNKTLGTKSMHSIIINPNNGEIYAAASLPLFNPSDIASAEVGSTDLKCVSTLYEPGSTFKSVAATAIFESGVLTPDSEIFCPSHLQADEFIVKDATDRDSQTFTFRQIMERSSNVGVSLATDRLGWDLYHNKLIEYKIGSKTGIDYPGDSQGYYVDFDKWSKIHAYNISFGQGVSVTPLQTCRFYSALENNGYMCQPHFLIRYLQSDHDEVYKSEEIIKNKEAVSTMNSVLRSVVANGTGQKANIEGYNVAGKTGTGEIADEKGQYLKNCYYSSFCGYLQGTNQPLLIFLGGERIAQDMSVTANWKDIMNMSIERLRIVNQE